MAVTPNNIVTPQSIGTIVGQIATGDQTTPSDFGTATTNGRLVYNVLIYPGATDREVTLYIHNGTAARKVAMIDVAADAAADIVPEDILVNVPLPVDANGNKVLYVAAGHKLQLSAENVAQTNDAIAVCQEL
jgi:hypothetical protein